MKIKTKPYQWLSVGVGSLVLAMASFQVSAQASLTASLDQKPAIASAKAAKSLLQKIVRIDGRLLAVGERGHIVFSDDNGLTWTQASVPTRAMLTGVSFPVPTTGWAVGYDGLVLKTEDAGATWTIQLDGNKFARSRLADAKPAAEQEIAKLNAEREQVEAAMAAAEDAGADTTEFEDKLEDIDNRIANAEDVLASGEEGATLLAQPLLDVWFKDLNEGFAVGAFGEFLKTSDGGATWADISARLGNTDRYHLNAISGIGNTMIIAGESGSLFRSKDGGESWVQLESPDEELGSYFSITFETENEIMIGGLRGSLYRSSDAGDTFEQIDEDLRKNMNGIYFAENDVVLAVGNEGALLVSRDGGNTFESHVRSDRLTITSAVEAKDGAYVLVGGGGVKRLTAADLQAQ